MILYLTLGMSNSTLSLSLFFLFLVVLTKLHVTGNLWSIIYVTGTMQHLLTILKDILSRVGKVLPLLI